MSIDKDSKKLSYLLRHNPKEMDLNIDSKGWVKVSELVKNSNGLFTRKYLEEIVEKDEKNRYSFSFDKQKIRANQGHSINVNPDLEEMIPPEELFHGTAERFISNIKKEGIKKQTRQFVHLSSDKETAIKVGKRHGYPVIITINTKKMYEDGIKFYISENKVWLVDYIDPKYFKTISNN